MNNKLNNIKKIISEDKISFKKNWTTFINDGKKAINEFKNPETRKKQIPNAFTASRLLAPFFVIPTALTGNMFATGLVAGLFALTDGADGYFARKYNATSEFGRELDPVVDKLFAGSLIIPLIFFNPIILINLILEAVIAAINLHSRLNDNKPRTTIIGKIKTGTLSLTMIISYLGTIVSFDSSIINSLIALTGALQIITANKYYNNYKEDENKKSNKINILENKSPLSNDEQESLTKKVNLKPKKNISTSNPKLTVNEQIAKLNDFRNELLAKEDEEKVKVYEKK